MAKLVAALSLLAASSDAHLCALNPLQRGGVSGAQKPGADICGQGAAPCGAVKAGAPVAAYLTGEQHGIHLLKNLDHYNKTDPGSFTVYLWDAAGKSVKLNEVADTAAPSQTEYIVDIKVPRVPAGNYTIQSSACHRVLCLGKRAAALTNLHPPLPPHAPRSRTRSPLAVYETHFPPHPFFYQCSDIEILF